jgi:hypothetical protein
MLVNSQLISPVVDSNASIQLPVTELVLEIDKPLLIVLAPISQTSWCRERKGVLSLCPNQIINWVSDDFSFPASHYGRSISGIESHFKPYLCRHGWEMFLSASGGVWYEYMLGECQYKNNLVTIAVGASSFRLGGSN